MRYFILAFIMIGVLIFSIAGWRGQTTSRRPIEIFPDMDHQAKIKAQAESHFFADGIGARQPIAGTVPMGFDVPEKAAHAGGQAAYGFSQGVDYYNTGRVGDFYGDGMPKELGELTPAFVNRGRERYNIYCTVCHGAAGDGKGVVGQFGLNNIASLTQNAFTDPAAPTYKPDGSIFNTITHGQGLMGAYGSNIAVRDRWAIIGYVRALQDAAKNPPAAPDAAAPTEPATTE